MKKVPALHKIGGRVETQFLKYENRRQEHFKEDIKMTNKHMKKMIYLDWQSGKQNENIMRYNFTTPGWKRIKNLSIRNVCSNVVKCNSAHRSVNCENILKKRGRCYLLI